MTFVEALLRLDEGELVIPGRFLGLESLMDLGWIPSPR